MNRRSATGMFPDTGSCYDQGMYVVGANLLSEFWRAHPEAEGELRALHALLAASEARALAETLGRTAAFDGAGAEIALRHARVRIEINRGAGVGRYAAVAPVEEDGE